MAGRNLLYSKILCEEFGLLYHITGINTLWSILRHDRFETTYALGTEAEASHGKSHGKAFYMSTSHVPVNRYSSHGGAVMLVLDGDKLRQRYRIKPVNYWGLMGQQDSESEERLFTDDSEIKNFKSYIKEVHVLWRKDVNQEWYHGLGAYNDKFPIYFYDDRKAFFLLDKRRAKPLEELVQDDPGYPDRNVGTRSHWDVKEYHSMDEFVSFLEGGGKNRKSKWYQYLRYYHSDFLNQAAADVHNFRSKHGPETRIIWQRLEAVRRKYGATDLRDLIKKFIAAHGGN